MVLKLFTFGRNILSSQQSFRFPSAKISLNTYVSSAGSKSQDVVQLPEKPKKPMSAFFRFIKEHKPVVLKENPNYRLVDIVKKCSEDWKNAHSTVRARYESEYKEDLEAYSKKFMDYSMKLTSEQKAHIKELNKEKREGTKKRKAKKKLRTLNKPKRPLSPFTMYLLDQARITNKKYNELMLEMKGQWKALDENTKLPYIKKGEEAKLQYKKDLEAWELKMLQEGNTDFIRAKTLEEKRPASHKGKRSVSGEKESSIKTTSPKTMNE